MKPLVLTISCLILWSLVSAQEITTGRWSLVKFSKKDLSTHVSLPVEESVLVKQLNAVVEFTDRKELLSNEFVLRNLQVQYEIINGSQIALVFTNIPTQGESQPSMNGATVTGASSRTNFNYELNGKALRLFREDVAYAEEYFFERK